MRNTVLFDLDGTLLPMDQNTFIKDYFGRLTRRFEPLGVPKEALVDAVWKGTYAMIANDGSMPNRERFWQTFWKLLPGAPADAEAQCNDFYAHEFDKVREVAALNDLARRALALLRQKGYGVTLATNPVFPAVAVRTRLGWLGLSPEDFDLVTTYENSRYCKPNPLYFADICKTIGRTPAECYMVGNNTDDDMSAAKIGMETYLVTDYLENEKKLDVAAWPHGSLADALDWLQTLPAVR